MFNHLNLSFRYIRSILILFCFGIGFVESNTQANVLMSLPFESSSVEIVQMSASNSEREQDYFDQVCRVYIRVFKSVYIDLANTSSLDKQLFLDCMDDVNQLKNPGIEKDFIFLVARDTETHLPFGMAAFEYDLKSKDLYLSSFLSEKRGLGKHILCAVFHLVHDVNKINLIVREGNQSAIRKYREWGFEESDFRAPQPYVPGIYLGRTLKGSSLIQFFESCR